MTDFATRYGPWALIAGASEGLGAAFAEELAKKGLNLVLVARRMDRLAEVQHRLEDGRGVKVRCLAEDLADPDALSRIGAQIADLEIGLLIYNAALTTAGSFLELSLSEQQRIIDVNVRNPLALAHTLGAPMRGRGRGGIILMSSLTAFQGSPFVATYGASKAFNLALGEALWLELASSGIDVLTVCAGATRTPNYLRQATQRAPGELEPLQVAREALQGLGRGPLLIPGRFNRFASQLMRRLLPRRLTIRLMASQTRDFAENTAGP